MAEVFLEVVMEDLLRKIGRKNWPVSSVSLSLSWVMLLLSHSQYYFLSRPLEKFSNFV